MKQVLIADDEKFARRTLRAMLARLPVELQEAVDGQQASELVLQKDFDLVISDYMMPKMDGLELFSWCRWKSPDLPFILISGLAPEDLEKLDEIHFLQKPFRLESLLSLVSSLLNLPASV